MTDPEELKTLQIHVNRLEKENRIMRQQLWDDYFQASMIGVISNYGSYNGMSPSDFARDAAKLADAMLRIREERNV